MTSPPAERVTVLGTGLMGTSIAMAAVRAGFLVTGWDADPDVTVRAAARGGFAAAPSLEDAVRDARVVVVATPIGSIADVVALALEHGPEAVVTDAGSVKSVVVREVAGRAPVDHLERFVAAHPMGGGERSGPEHASASVVDGVVWVIAPGDQASAGAVEVLEGFVRRIGALPVRMSPERHDRLVAFVSHLPQVASSMLMGVAATEEAGEPDMLLLAAGGFRDLTRLASSDPSLWSEILLANGHEIVMAIDAYVARLESFRAMIERADPTAVAKVFEDAKRARLRLAAKPQVRSGVAVLQVGIADRPGALAEITAALGRDDVNIEDLQIVHSFEGGHGTVHLTVSGDVVDRAMRVLATSDLDPIRLA